MAIVIRGSRINYSSIGHEIAIDEDRAKGKKKKHKGAESLKEDFGFHCNMSSCFLNASLFLFRRVFVNPSGRKKESFDFDPVFETNSSCAQYLLSVSSVSNEDTFSRSTLTRMRRKRFTLTTNVTHDFFISR